MPCVSSLSAIKYFYLFDLVSTHYWLILFLAVTILKFGRANSDLLAYGAADGSLMVCQVSEPPSVLQKMIGHSKNITG
jgi:hypothetical protein